MPAIAPREFVRELDNVLTLLQPAQIYLLPTAPEDEHAWPPERNMLVWKDEWNRWHFKMLLLGEQHQGLFDSNFDDDRRVITGLNALAIHSDVSEEVSEQLGPNVCARIARPCLYLSSAQQGLIIAALFGAWPLADNEDTSVAIEACLALLRGSEAGLSAEASSLYRGFSSYLTLEEMDRRLVGGRDRVAQFCQTNPDVTYGDVLKFIQLLLMASVRALGHDEPVVLPAPPVGHDRNFHHAQDVPQWGGHLFEAALSALETSVLNLSDAERALVAQSLRELRQSNSAWRNAGRNTADLLTFKRTTDEVLRADHIQRLYTHPRFPNLGMFSDRVASPELQELKLSLRGLRDLSDMRARAFFMMNNFYRNIKLSLLFSLEGSVLDMLLNVNLTFLLNIPIVFIVLSAILSGIELAIICGFIFFDTIEMRYVDHSFLDVCKASFEAHREFFTHDLPLLQAATLVVSLGYGVCVGEVSASVALLAIFGFSFLAMMALGMALFVGVGSYMALGAVTQALGSYFNYSDLAQNEPVPLGAYQDF